MINRLIIEYFQNWVKNDITLSHRLNVFIGSSDQGKSVITKLLKWVKDNRPSGISFKNRKFKDKDTVGKIILPEGTVTRVRGPNKNYYRINKEKPLKALNRNVPKEVSQLLQLEDINIKGQFDGFFLLQDSPGVVAKKFNEFVGLSLIDQVSSEAEKTVRTYNREMLQCENEINTLTEDLKQYQTLDKVELLLAKAQKLEEEIIKSNLEVENITALIKEYKIYKETHDNIPNLKEIKENLKQADKLEKQIYKSTKLVQDLRSLLIRYIEFEDKTKITENINEIGKLFKKAEQLQKSIEIDVESISRVKEYVDRYKQFSVYSKQSERDLTALKKKLDSIHNKLEICPLCKQEWRQK